MKKKYHFLYFSDFDFKDKIMRIFFNLFLFFLCFFSSQESYSSKISLKDFYFGDEPVLDKNFLDVIYFIKKDSNLHLKFLKKNEEKIRDLWKVRVMLYLLGYDKENFKKFQKIEDLNRDASAWYLKENPCSDDIEDLFEKNKNIFFKGCVSKSTINNKKGIILIISKIYSIIKGEELSANTVKKVAYSLQGIKTRLFLIRFINKNWSYIINANKNNDEDITIIHATSDLIRSSEDQFRPFYNIDYLKYAATILDIENVCSKKINTKIYSDKMKIIFRKIVRYYNEESYSCEVKKNLYKLIKEVIIADKEKFSLSAII